MRKAFPVLSSSSFGKDPEGELKTLAEYVRSPEQAFASTECCPFHLHPRLFRSKWRASLKTVSVTLDVT